ncbi:MAG: hypothetical protein ACI90V_010706, partial [Bacillariaceae sp.]
FIFISTTSSIDINEFGNEQQGAGGVHLNNTSAIAGLFR